MLVPLQLQDWESAQRWGLDVGPPALGVTASPMSGQPQRAGDDGGWARAPRDPRAEVGTGRSRGSGNVAQPLPPFSPGGPSSDIPAFPVPSTGRAGTVGLRLLQKAEPGLALAQKELKETWGSQDPSGDQYPRSGFSTCAVVAELSLTESLPDSPAVSYEAGRGLSRDLQRPPLERRKVGQMVLESLLPLRAPCTFRRKPPRHRGALRHQLIPQGSFRPVSGPSSRLCCPPPPPAEAGLEAQDRDLRVCAHVELPLRAHQLFWRKGNRNNLLLCKIYP